MLIPKTMGKMSPDHVRDLHGSPSIIGPEAQEEKVVSWAEPRAPLPCVVLGHHSPRPGHSSSCMAQRSPGIAWAAALENTSSKHWELPYSAKPADAECKSGGFLATSP